MLKSLVRFAIWCILWCCLEHRSLSCEDEGEKLNKAITFSKLCQILLCSENINHTNFDCNVGTAKALIVYSGLGFSSWMSALPSIPTRAAESKHNRHYRWIRSNCYSWSCRYCGYFTISLLTLRSASYAKYTASKIRAKPWSWTRATDYFSLIFKVRCAVDYNPEKFELFTRI